MNKEQFLELLSKFLIERENIEGYFLTPQIEYTADKTIRLWFQCNNSDKHETKLTYVDI